MSGPDWYRWYPAKWASGVILLTPEQRGVYMDIINVIFDRGSCPEDYAYLSKVCNCRVPRVRRIVGELAQHGKLTIVSGTIRQEKAHNERINSEQFSELQRNRGRKRHANVSKNKDMASAANGLAITTTTTTTEHNPPIDTPPQQFELEGPANGSGKATTPAKPAAKPRRKASTPIPDDWNPDVGYARQHGMSDRDINFQANKMADWAKANDIRRQDWAAQWRNWVRGYIEKRAH